MLVLTVNGGYDIGKTKYGMLIKIVHNLAAKVKKKSRIVRKHVFQ